MQLLSFQRFLCIFAKEEYCATLNGSFTQKKKDNNGILTLLKNGTKKKKDVSQRGVSGSILRIDFLVYRKIGDETLKKRFVTVFAP